MDGLLSYYPKLMDFLHVDVKSMDYLAWRLNRLVKESVILKEIHESEYGKDLYKNELRKISKETYGHLKLSTSAAKKARGRLAKLESNKVNIDELMKSAKKQKKMGAGDYEDEL